MKELHLYLRYNDIPANVDLHLGYNDTLEALRNNVNLISTTQTHFCSMTVIVDYGYRLFVHPSKNDVFEITKQGCNRTNKQLRYAHNLEKLLLAGEFGFYTV